MFVKALERIRDVLGRFAEAFDPALVTAGDAQRVVAVASTIEKMAAAIKTLAAARVAETDLWRTSGARSAAHELARQTGVGVGAAKDAITAGKRLRQLPLAAGAAKAGELSQQQAQAIADAASADPTAERRLVEKAKRSSLGELKDECARTKAAAEDLEERRRRIHRERFCRKRTTPDGAGEIHYRSTVENMARVWAVLQAFFSGVFEQAKVEGSWEHTDAYMADALGAMAEAAARAHAGDHGTNNGNRGPNPQPAGSGTGLMSQPPADAANQTEPRRPGDGDPPDQPRPEDAGAAAATQADLGLGLDPTPDPNRAPTPAARDGKRRAKPPVPATILVRIDWDALIRGYPITGEMSEIAGYGPVPVSVIDDIMATGDPFLAAVVTKGNDVINVAHLGRRHTAHQRTAMAWRDPMCCVEGCTATIGLEHDHRHDWATTKVTLLAWSDRLCGHHHDLKTHHGWRLVTGHGKRAMVPPGHPDHPGDDPPQPPVLGPPSHGATPTDPRARAPAPDGRGDQRADAGDQRADAVTRSAGPAPPARPPNARPPTSPEPGTATLFPTDDPTAA